MQSPEPGKQIAVITGAGGGLGSHVTSSFLEAGIQVVGLARSPGSGSTGGGRYLGMAVDLADAGSTRKAVDAIVDRFGRIHILVHLVGGFYGGKPITETDDETINLMLNINLRSAFHIARIVVPYMRTAGFGRIIAVGSRLALEPQPLTGAYAASKAALVSLIRTLALENADARITANVVLPTTIDTPANRASMPDADHSRWVKPSEVAKVILWLSSEEAAQVSGAVIPIYGQDV